MTAKILVAASSQTRAKTLGKALAFLRRGVEITVGTAMPRSVVGLRLVVIEFGPRLADAGPLLAKLPDNAHVVVLLSKPTVKDVALLMQDPRVSHVLRKPREVEQLKHLRHVADKLASGSIFGLERYLPDQSNIVNRRISSYAERCQAIDELLAYTRKKRLRGSIRRACSDVAEELLMNAMYHAPVDDAGKQVFADLSPQARLKRKTPRPVSLRYAVHDQSLFLSVRDRFGSLQRADLVHYLTRCTTEDVQIEQKKLGAGLGLYLVASKVPRMVINVLPGSVSEVICMLDKPEGEASPLTVFSFTAQRPQIQPG